MTTDPDEGGGLGESPLEQCLKAIAALGGQACPEEECVGVSRYAHAVCNCEEPYLNGCAKEGAERPACCAYGPATPVFVASERGACYCCCLALANESMIATDETTVRSARDLAVGDPIWVALNAELTRWGRSTVQFSSGTGSGGESNLILIRFGDPDQPGALYASRDQLFLLPGGRLKRAAKLLAGGDSLVRPNGETVPILDLTPSPDERGVHHIATAVEPGVTLAGHLLVINGVVGADYSLQVANLEREDPDVLVDGHEELPEFGTEEYAAAERRSVSR